MNDAARPDHVHPDTLLVSGGREPRQPGGQVGAPLVLTSTFHADGDVIYARAGNPTFSAFEETLGALEGGDALAFSSGMAAVAAVVSLVPLGGVVVAPAEAYNGVCSLLAELEQAGTLAVRRVDIADSTEVLAALPGADLLWIESPTNPLLEVADTRVLTAAARERGVLVAADNTFATPLLRQPLGEGVDVVVHSATKYLAGHSDVILGAVVTAPDARGHGLHERLATHRTLHGAVPGPSEVWLALRGMRTLHLRLARSCATASLLAERLARHPAVERVRYPGFGAIASIEVRGGAEASEAVCGATRLWVHATSLGGVESLLERRRRIPTEPIGVPDNLIRLSVGIEDAEDLWHDLATALGG